MIYIINIKQIIYSYRITNFMFFEIEPIQLKFNIWYAELGVSYGATLFCSKSECIVQRNYLN